MKIIQSIPNIITVGRLFFTIVILALTAANTPGRNLSLWDVTCALFIVAMITDVIDGYIARSYGSETQLGRILDPLVDKLLICGLFAVFADGQFSETGVRGWMTAIIVGREILVTSLRGMGEAKGVNFAALFSGKLKLCVQTVTLIAIFIYAGHFQGIKWARILRDAAIWMTLIETVWSAWAYLVLAKRTLLGVSQKNNR